MIISEGKVVIDTSLGGANFAKSIKGLKEKFNKEKDAIVNSVVGIDKMASSIGLDKLGSTAINIVKDSIPKAFDRIDAIESFKRVMSDATGSTELANSALERTGSIVNGTAYSLDVAAQGVQDFVTRGVDVDKATSRIEAWGDAVAFYGNGSNEQLTSVTSTLSEMTKNGQVDLGQLNNLFDNGIDAVGMYAKATGRDTESVQKDLAAGALTAEGFIDTVTTAMTEGTNGVTNISGAAKELGGTWDTAFDSMQSSVANGVVSIIQGIDEMLTSNGLPDMQTMVAEFGRYFEEVLTTIGENIPPVVEQIKEIYNNLEPWLPLLGAIAAGLGTVVTSAATFNSLNEVMKKLNNTILMNPYVWLAAAIVAAAVLIYIYWEPISEFFINLWESIKESALLIWEILRIAWQETVEWFKELWLGIVDFFTELWTGIVEYAITIWDSFTEKIDEVVSLILTLFAPLIEFFITMWTTIFENTTQIWDNLIIMLSTVWTNIQTMAAALWELIKIAILAPILLLIDLVTGDMEGFASHLSQIWLKIQEAASAIWKALKENVSIIISTLVENLKLIWGIFLTYITGIWTAIWETGKNIFNLIKDTIKEKMDEAKNKISEIWESIKAKFSIILIALVAMVISKFLEIRRNIQEKMNEAKATLQEIWNNIVLFILLAAIKIVKSVTDKFNEIKQAVKDKMDEARQNIEDAWNKARDFLANIDLLQIGKNIIQGLINGLGSMVGKVTEKITGIATTIKNGIKGALGIRSPSRWMRDMIGKNMMTGWEIGMERKKGSVQNMSSRASEWMKPEVPDLSDVMGNLKSLATPVRGLIDVGNVGLPSLQINSQQAQAIARQEDVASSNEKNPATINVYVGAKKIASEIVDDLTKLQERKTFRKSRNGVRVT
ncbi:phage tail protein [Alkalicoccobacillus plakortidis]|uniref:Tape measure protein n=1 Tax=Alkalicoccobacillus plakortidis TaxID=444060 RepID=A0ABT0XI05_9BACI|nr:tape measure protein [Alkalicoccobacillus plakortidis]MCM2675546.1 tape measure protein [Alkalicoccobacillus plakortidis]